MAIFYLYIFLCVAATAVFWFIQLVHYPLMPFVENAKWAAFIKARQKFTMIFLYPLIISEVLTGLSLLIIAQRTKSYPILAASVILLICLVILSFIYLHPQLKKISGPDDKINQEKFLQLHLLRAWGWTARFLLILLILLAAE